MEVRARITGDSLTQGIRFYGETNADEDSVNRIRELKSLLEDVFWQLNKTYDQADGRGEHSAKEIINELELMKSDLKELYFET